MSARLLDALARIGAPGQGDLCLLWPENRQTIDLLLGLPGLRVLHLILDQQAAWQAGLDLPVTLADGDALLDLQTGPFDLLLARHPDLFQRPARWENALWFAREHLSPGGRLLLTTQVQAEAYGLHEIASRLGLRLRDGSPYTALPVALDGADRYILVYEA